MKKAFAVSTIFIVIVVLIVFLFSQYIVPAGVEHKDENYVGVTYCGDSVENGKLLIDKVKGYTNLFVLQSGTLQRNLDSVTELGDYAVSAGLYFLPYFGSYVSPSLSSWIDSAKQRWGTHFVGIYYDDEPGGKMLDDNVEFKDGNSSDTITKTRYGDIAVHKVNGIFVHYEIGGTIHLFEPAEFNGTSNFAGTNQTQKSDIYATFYSNGTIIITESSYLDSASNPTSNWHSLITYQDLLNQRPFKDTNEIADRFYARNQANINFLANSTKIFTSDYALYWFDYKAGYNVVLAQIGWNNSLTQNIALIRGAAKLQDKDWGTIITWKYDKAPYLDNGSEILNQMLASYNCGAKYIILFNYYDGSSNPYGTMKDEHFVALETFWDSTFKNSNNKDSTQATQALVLPKNYGCGLRWIQDRIWGVIEPNQDSIKIWNAVQKALERQNYQLDIVYDDAQFPAATKYHQVRYWNQTE